MVGDVRHEGLTTEAKPAVFSLHAQVPGYITSLVVRTDGDPFGHAAAIRRAIHEVDPTQAVSTVGSLEQDVDRVLSRPRLQAGDRITLSFTLSNTGKMAGAEVVQLYLRDPVASVVRPLEELKGFQRIVLAPGEQRTVSFTVDREMLSFYDDRMRWTAEPGKFELMVGSASDDIRLRGEIELTD